MDQVDAFSVILSIIICIISLLAFRENRSRMPLYIGIGFAIFGFSYFLALFNASLEIDYLVLLIRMFAFVTVLFAVYTNLGEVRTQITLLSEKNKRLEGEITERINAEQALRNSEAQLNAVILGSPIPQFVIDKNHRVLYWNNALQEATGIRSEEIIGTNQHWKAFYLEERPCMADLLVDGAVEQFPIWYAGKYNQSLLVEGAYEATDFIPHIGKEGLWLHNTAAPIWDESGTIIGAVEILEDITERKNAEQALRNSEARMKAVISGSPIPQFVIDKDHKVIYWNDALAEYSGIRSETVIGTNQQWKAFSDHERPSMADLLLDGAIESTSQFIKGLWERSTLIQGAYFSRVPIRKKGESESWLDFTAAPIHDASGTIIGAVETLEDITDRILRDEHISKMSALKERLLGAQNLDIRLKMITDGVVEIFSADFSRIWMLEKSDLCEKGCVHASVNEGPHICRDRSRCLHLLASSGRYTHINGGHGRVPVGAYKIGRVASGEYPGFVTNDVTHDPRVHNHDWAQLLGLVSFAGYRLSSEENMPIGVLALFSKHTITPWEEDLLKDLAHTASQIIIRGMAGKAIRESEAKFRSLTENTPDIVFSTDLNGTITYVSPKINEIGFLVEEIVGRTLVSLAHPDDRKRIMEEFTTQLHERARFDSTFRIPDKWEIIHDFEERSNLILDEYGNPVEIDGLMWDITDRKNAEDEIRRSLQEKEVLLKEIHHRVKNNLQVVWGLIDLQIQSIRDPVMINTLRDSQNRVRTMSLIHETLYRSDDLSHIRISQYLHNLMDTLFSAYSISP
ncbi:MAG: PAS domain S-box protein, partial [Methanoregula sp.]|nr:PAS domain S-box protein [Methanoregula sp.]